MWVRGDPDQAFNGLVDLNGDGDITAADTCSDGCFFGHDLKWCGGLPR